ncbi:ubiquitin-related domain-containing protein [Mycotypha africana]|uniref:ubiquitin-related domain-containing protein n=1 Tax=Mycotypha africana TaxID=64632 RepID=UPI002300235A|nr:ubiquitin-related domain-containing protein [Mycotypha africana]KAI8979783.1 ubiquitin-related domain-containing protein [Mycotypha africana]
MTNSKKALRATNNAGLQPALDWILNHSEVSEEPDEEPVAPEALGTADSSSSQPDKEATHEEGEIKDGEQTAQSLICNDCQKLFRDATGAELHATRTGHQNFAESTEAIKPLTEEEKKQKLIELKARMAEKRAAREKAEKEERKQAEKIRRKAGQEMTLAKEALEQKEMKKMMDQKKREREEEKLAKARIKAQIEQDKKERAAKREAAKQQAQAHAVEAASGGGGAAAFSQATTKKEYTESRIQIRLPGAGPVTNTFDANSTLSDVFTFLQNQGCNTPFNLSTTFPRKTFSADDRQRTLKELNLVPSAALVLSYL